MARANRVGRVAVTLSILLLVLSAVDLVVTEIGIRHFGGVELNPLLAPLIGTPWALVVKLGLPATILLLAPKARAPFIARALKLAVVFYVAITVFNVTQLIVLAA